MTKLQITAMKPNYMKESLCAHSEGIWCAVKSLCIQWRHVVDV